VIRPTGFAAVACGLVLLAASCGASSSVKRGAAVRIDASTCSGSRAGSGTLVGSRLVVTTAHLVDGASRIALRLGGQVVGRGFVVGRSAQHDVALVRSDRPIAGPTGGGVASPAAARLVRTWSRAPQLIAAPDCAAPPVAQTAPHVATMTDSLPLVFRGRDFSIYYPSNWVVRAADVESGGGRRETTIAPAGQSGSLIRVDESRARAADTPETVAGPLVARLRRDRQYDELDLTRTTFDGFDALRWEYESLEHGVRLHRVAVVFVDRNARLAWTILTQAPAREWAGAASGFDDYRQTFQYT
jgi:hypothetical protein